MKTLVLKDGTEIQVLDESNSSQIRIEIEDFGDADTLLTNFTRENMEQIQLGVEIFNQVNPVASAVNRKDGRTILTVYCQESLQDYINTQIDNYTERLIEEGVI